MELANLADVSSTLYIVFAKKYLFKLPAYCCDGVRRVVKDGKGRVGGVVLEWVSIRRKSFNDGSHISLTKWLHACVWRGGDGWGGGGCKIEFAVLQADDVTLREKEYTFIPSSTIMGYAQVFCVGLTSANHNRNIWKHAVIEGRR